MDKLTLEHLAPYLPYELEFHLPIESERYLDLIDEEPWRFTHTLETAIEHGYASAIELLNSKYSQKDAFIAIEDGELFLGCLKSNFGWDIDDVFVKEVKPILRPLSDLTKDIEHNGERFVPIDRINRFRIKSPDTFVHKEWTGICDREINIDLTTYGGGSWEGGMEEDIDTFQFYQLYTLLFKWHFDVFSLIAAGLAVDANTLEGGSSDGN